MWHLGWKSKKLKIQNLNLGSQCVLGNSSKSMSCRNNVSGLFWRVRVQVLARVVFVLLILFLVFLIAMVTYSIFLSFQLLIRSVILGISVSWEKAKFCSKFDSYRLPPSFYFNILDSSSFFFLQIYTVTKQGGGSTSYVLLVVPCH